MNLPLLAIDNITDLLVKIIEFTNTRQKILIQNIHNISSAGFVPKDLLVEEFCNLLNYAIDEHIQNQRLVLCDTQNIKFGISGSFEARPVIDNHAKYLLEEDRDAYIELQIGKLFENSLNQRIAAELLKQKQGAISVDY